MKALREVNGYYGSGNTKCLVLVCSDMKGGSWYVVEGGKIVNYTYDKINDGVNVEYLEDVDCITANVEVDSLEDLEHLIDFE